MFAAHSSLTFRLCGHRTKKSYSDLYLGHDLGHKKANLEIIFPL